MWCRRLLSHFVVAVGGSLLVCSCASYRVGPRPAGDDSEPPPGSTREVAVETVATPAEWGMDGARLTRRLIGLLANRGVAAEWREGSAEGATVRCSADGPMPEAFRASAAARVSLVCRVDREDERAGRIRTRGTAASAAPTAPETRLGASLPAVMERAAIDALERAAPRITDRLASLPDSQPPRDARDG